MHNLCNEFNWFVPDQSIRISVWVIQRSRCGATLSQTQLILLQRLPITITICFLRKSQNHNTDESCCIHFGRALFTSNDLISFECAQTEDDDHWGDIAHDSRQVINIFIRLLISVSQEQNETIWRIKCSALCISVTICFRWVIEVVCCSFDFNLITFNCTHMYLSDVVYQLKRISSSFGECFYTETIFLVQYARNQRTYSNFVNGFEAQWSQSWCRLCQSESNNMRYHPHVCK